MTVLWQPFREPFRKTLVRTGTIALVGGAVLARGQGGLAHWPAATVLMLWPALGGHWVEVGFLNHLRPRLPATRAVQAAVRIAVWLVGGAVLALGMGLTAIALTGRHPPHWPAGWLAGGAFAFVGLELIVHLVLQLRRCPNFFSGLG